MARSHFSVTDDGFVQNACSKHHLAKKIAFFTLREFGLVNSGTLLERDQIRSDFHRLWLECDLESISAYTVPSSSDIFTSHAKMPATCAEVIEVHSMAVIKFEQRLLVLSLQTMSLKSAAELFRWRSALVQSGHAKRLCSTADVLL